MWLSHGQEDDYMRLKFLSDEVELCVEENTL